MKILIAAALLAAPAQAHVPPPDRFCIHLKGLAAAAEETPAFASLGGQSLDALLGSYCVVPPTAVTMLCVRSLLPPEISAESLVARMEQCLPGFRITPDTGFRETRVEHGRLRIDIAENGGPGAHVGRTVTLYISAIPAEDSPPSG